MKLVKLIVTAALVAAPFALSAQDFVRIPYDWKWLDNKEAAFTYDGTFTDAFAVNAKNHKVREGVPAPEKYASFPLNPEGAVNLTYSPDSTMLAYTKANDLYVIDIASGKETRLTTDGTSLILNGYSSWVYYEEILGRPTRYKAFWWSPDSRKLAFYRFDDTNVPMFPIYSGKGQDGSIRETHYPKVGEPNPEVRIGIADIATSKITWADFNPKDDQYFGTPFWGADSKELFISRQPRIQHDLDVYSVNVETGAKTPIYHEHYKTWIDFITGMIFGKDGLYMARNFETGWQQIYYLSYDGKTFRRLTDGKNWRIALVRVDEEKGDVYFTAERDSRVRQALYKVDKNGAITAMTDPALNVSGVTFSPDGAHFVASLSNFTTPTQIWMFDARKPSNKPYKVADAAGKDFNPANYSLPQNVLIKSRDGFDLYGAIIYPKNFDPSKQYPVHVDIYGGPDTPVYRDSWSAPQRYEWWSENGIIEFYADNRASGECGREGLDMIYKVMDKYEKDDFVDWASWLKQQPWVKDEKIGVEGYSFGGMMTALLLFDESDSFHYGIGSSGVYDWPLYDTYYTEKFMETPQTNPDGYESTGVIRHAKNYPVKHATDPAKAAELEPKMLKLTHGTGDDNVHFQGSLQLVDELLKVDANFQFMMYPDGMHGYRDYQGRHFNDANRAFWLKYLKN